MNVPPIPVVFRPIFRARPWGGRLLASLLGKNLPAEERIGESWEIVSLPEAESVVRDGPLAGEELDRLLKEWGSGLVGRAELVDGRFPLLIKYLDARENLSVQVHPRPQPDDSAGWHAGVKHEAWVVLHAEPGSELLIGFRPGVQPDDLRRAANSPGVADLLRRWPARTGRCFYLPSGTPHALGAGIVVAEIQTPSDVTYRLYDWDRAGLDGRPRELHVEQGIANARFDVTDDLIVQPRSHVGGPFATLTRLVRCERFMIDKVRLFAGVVQAVPHAEMVIWMVIRGAGLFRRGEHRMQFSAGDVVLIPADSMQTQFETQAACEILEIKVPIRSSLADLPRPPAEAPPRRDGIIDLTEGGRPRRKD